MRSGVLANSSLRRAAAIIATLAAAAPARGEVAPGSRLTVIGGSPADGSRYASIGTLVRRAGSGSDSLVCTATAVSTRVLVTAAHCRSDWPIYFVLDGVEHEVTATVTHPDFDPSVGGHDVAAMRLAEPVALEESAALFEATALSVGDEVELVGYGPTSVAVTGGSERTRNAARAAVEDVSETEFVVGREGEVENCRGDSGGPAFVRQANELRLVGVASRAVDRDAPCVGGGVLTRLEGEREFLEEALVRAAPGDASPGCGVAVASGSERGVAIVLLCVATARARRSRRSRR